MSTVVNLSFWTGIPLTLTYGGLVLALKVFNGNLNGHFLGAGLVLFSAFIGALSYILTEVLSKRVSSVKISAYSTTACAFAFIGSWHGVVISTGRKENKYAAQ